MNCKNKKYKRGTTYYSMKKVWSSAKLRGSADLGDKSLQVHVRVTFSTLSHCHLMHCSYKNTNYAHLRFLTKTEYQQLLMSTTETGTQAELPSADNNMYTGLLICHMSSASIIQPLHVFLPPNPFFLMHPLRHSTFLPQCLSISCVAAVCFWLSLIMSWGGQ